MGDQFAALLRVVQIEHRQRHVLHFQRGRIAEHQHLDDGRADEQEAGVGIAQRLDEFLPQHVPDAREGLQNFIPASRVIQNSRFQIQKLPSHSG